MESSSLEIKVMFGKDLQAFNFFQKLTLYVLVSIISDDPGKKLELQKRRTPTDREGDGNPEWNHEMRFDLKRIPFQDCDHIFVQFELRHEGAMLGDKTIGEVRVPIKDLISEFNGVVRFVHYEVRNPEGKSNGVLSFSYKVNGMNLNSAIGGTTNYPGITTQITGYLQQPAAYEIQYPQAEYPSWSSPPGGSLYPRLDIQTTTLVQATYSTQQDVEYYASPAGSPFYPTPDAYYPPSPTVGPPFYPQQPFLPSPHYPDPASPSGFNPWPAAAAGPQVGDHNYSMPGTWGHSAGHVHSFGYGEESTSGSYQYGDYRHSSSWNGR